MLGSVFFPFVSHLLVKGLFSIFRSRHLWVTYLIHLWRHSFRPVSFWNEKHYPVCYITVTASVLMLADTGKMRLRDDVKNARSLCLGPMSHATIVADLGPGHRTGRHFPSNRGKWRRRQRSDKLQARKQKREPVIGPNTGTKNNQPDFSDTFRSKRRRLSETVSLKVKVSGRLLTNGN